MNQSCLTLLMADMFAVRRVDVQSIYSVVFVCKLNSLLQELLQLLH
jgi:hypothetical protein